MWLTCVIKNEVKLLLRGASHYIYKCQIMEGKPIGSGTSVLKKNSAEVTNPK